MVSAGRAAPSGGRLGEFKNLTLIGKGSFGRVYRAVRLSDNQEYALKELDMRPMQRKEREDCVNEVRILASSVNNPSIVRYFDAFMVGDSLWIVTELARGGDINAKLKRHTKRGELLSEDLIWAFFIQICQGLKYLHAANILHRDIKAPNIFITGPRSVKIGDLGVAKCTKHGMAQTQIGTPYYMSPELWKNQKYDKRSDVWSLGVLLYELAALKHPFLAQSERALCDKVVRGQYPPLPKCFSNDLTTMVKLMLQLDPSKRPTAEQLLEHPIVLKHMDCSPISCDSEVPFHRGELVGTIHVPKMLMDLQSRLPGAKYDTDSMYDCEPRSDRSSGSEDGVERISRRKKAQRGAQSMDEEVLSRSRSEGEFYRKRGGRIEHNVRKSHQSDNMSEIGFLPPLPSAVPSGRGQQGIVPLSRWSERPTESDAICHNRKLPVAGVRGSQHSRRDDMASFHNRRRPW